MRRRIRPSSISGSGADRARRPRRTATAAAAAAGGGSGHCDCGDCCGWGCDGRTVTAVGVDSALPASPRPSASAWVSALPPARRRPAGWRWFRLGGRLIALDQLLRHALRHARGALREHRPALARQLLLGVEDLRRRRSSVGSKVSQPASSEAERQRRDDRARRVRSGSWQRAPQLLLSARAQRHQHLDAGAGSGRRLRVGRSSCRTSALRRSRRRRARRRARAIRARCGGRCDRCRSAARACDAPRRRSRRR